MRAITDATGAKVESAIYRPFGEQSEWLQPGNASPETKGWIGERYDADAGLQYLNARYYDPALGLFLQPDWFEVTKPGVGTNRFSYSFNDPVNKIDPGGNDAEADEEDNVAESEKTKRLFGSPVSALRNIARYRERILASSKTYGVDPVGVASIMFQEKYMGMAADAKNAAAIARDAFKYAGPHPRSSYGLTEMQIGHAVEYGLQKGIINEDSKNKNFEAFGILENPELAIDMAAWLAGKNQKSMGTYFTGNQAGYAHNLGVEQYSDYLSGESVDVSIPQRSKDYQIAIEKTLYGDTVVPFPDFYYENPDLCGGC